MFIVAQSGSDNLAAEPALVVTGDDIYTAYLKKEHRLMQKSSP